jgi:H+/Cl- antiporter ClcA
MFQNDRERFRQAQTQWLSRSAWVPRLVFWVGALAISVTAVLFAQASTLADGLFHRATGFTPYLALIITPAGLAVSVLLTRTVFPGAQGSGIPQVIAATEMQDPSRIRAVLSLRVAMGKIALTLLGLGCGASIGREGPTVQIGAAIMRALGQRFGKQTPGDSPLQEAAKLRALVLAGGAAGIAAAFNTPLAGVVFAIEELSRSFEQRTSGTVLTAVIISGIATLAMTGGGSYFGHTAVMLPFGVGWEAVLACALLGGLFGGGFSRVLIRAASGLPGAAGRFVGGRPVLFAAMCGVALAVLGLMSHGNTYGTGYAQAQAMVAGESHLPGKFFIMKLAATVISYASGIPGGIFAPSLAIGAGLGRTIAHLLPAAPAGAVVLLGMVAYFSGVVQAPITAAVIVMEMTDNQQMTVPLMAASFLAFGVSKLVCPHPLYGALAERFISAMNKTQDVNVAASPAPPVEQAGDGPLDPPAD